MVLDTHADAMSQWLIGRAAPASARARPSRGSERFYVGRRPHTTEVYVVSGTDIAPLGHPNSPTRVPFDWGEPTEGALELAFAILAHTTDSRPPDPVCLAFSTVVVARLDRGGFVLADGEIALWLLTAFRHVAGSSDAHHRGLRTRAISWARSRLLRG
jgi:hypothetical protein